MASTRATALAADVRADAPQNPGGPAGRRWPVIRYFGVIFDFSSARAHFSSNKRKRAAGGRGPSLAKRNLIRLRSPVHGPLHPGLITHLRNDVNIQTFSPASPGVPLCFPFLFPPPPSHAAEVGRGGYFRARRCAASRATFPRSRIRRTRRADDDESSAKQKCGAERKAERSEARYPDFHSDGTRSHGVRARAVCNENLSQWRRESLSHLAPGTCLARVAARANELFTHQASLAGSRTTVRFHFLNFRSLGGDPSLIKNL